MSVSTTFFQELSRQVQAAASKIAIGAHGRNGLSYAGLVAHMASTLQTLNKMGAGKGDRVAIVLPGGAELATACLSVAAGAVATPINPDFKQAEYETVLKRLAPKIVLTLAGGQHPVRSACTTLGIPVVDVIVNADSVAGLFQLSAAGQTPPPVSTGLAGPDDVALVLQTSGTTSVPKTVPLTHRNLVASAGNLVKSLQLTAEDRCLHFLPMFHIGGLVDVLIAPLVAGGSTFIAPSFSSAEFFRDLKAFHPTWTQAVPVMLQEILNTADAHSAAVGSHQLRFVRSVSAPLPGALMQAFEARFNVPVIEIFGMTETAGVITSNPLPPALRIAGSVGVGAGMEVRIVDSANQPMPAGQTGEVVVRGENLMRGYDADPKENERLFSEAGFRTGDLGYLDANGYLFLTGRAKDMINRGGEKVSPHEVDQLLLSHPAVADAASFAVPHPTLGEDVGAVVVLREGASATQRDLSAFLRDRLAFFKIPRAIHVVDVIPRGANGKLQRAVLSEKFGGMAAPAEVAGRSDFVAPQDPVGQLIASMWQDILKVDAVGMDDDFFALGGESLKAASFVNALQQKWGDTIYVSSLFDAPTLGRYQNFLKQHYPDVVARMLGQSVAPKAAESRITPALVAELRAAIARPAPMKGKPARKNPPAVFVLSPPRSGSTLLRAMLGGHPDLFSPPELYLLAFNTLAERKEWFSGSQRFQLEGNIRALMQVRNQPLDEVQAFMAALEARACPTQEYYGLMQEWLGKRLLVDKTPAYAIHPETLERAEDYFQDAIYIHLLRHPYGMIRSFEEAKLEQLWYPRLVGADAGHPDASPYGRRQLAEMIWLILHENILAFLQKIPAHRQFRLRFEDVVQQPEQAMRDVCVRLGLDYTPDMVKPQGDKKQRMTDGIHDVSRMIGDPKFHQHKKIESGVAETWKSAYDVDFLSDATSRLAQSLGYTETVADARGRQDFEL